MNCDLINSVIRLQSLRKDYNGSCYLLWTHAIVEAGLMRRFGNVIMQRTQRLLPIIYRTEECYHATDTTTTPDNLPYRRRCWLLLFYVQELSHFLNRSHSLNGMFIGRVLYMFLTTRVHLFWRVCRERKTRLCFCTPGIPLDVLFHVHVNYYYFVIFDIDFIS